MVLGMKSKRKKGASVKIDYIIHVQEITPWPPSESLRSIQTVLLQWENGDQTFGSFLTVAGNSNIVFNESFTLPLTLYRDKKAPDRFLKNYLEFSLFEPRKDKAKGSLLATAVLNLADYGVTEDVSSINVPVNFKKSSNNLVQSVLNISLEPVERDGSNSSYMDNESEIASLTDDDASSHSSRTAGSFPSSPSRNDKDVYGNAGFDHNNKAPNKNLRLLSTNGSSDAWSRVNDYVSSSKFTERSMTSVKKNFASPLIISSPTSTSFRDINMKSKNTVASFIRESSVSNSHNMIISNNKNKTTTNSQQFVNKTSFDSLDDVPLNDARATSEEASRRLETIVVPNRKAPPAVPPSGINKARLKHVKSVQIHGSDVGNGFQSNGGKPSDLDIPNGSQKKGRVSGEIERKEISEGKNEWKSRVEMLEEELREIAAIEIGLYSVVAEHASSGNKVHAPARRIARFYTKACRGGSQGKRASAARAVVSSLVLVSKACGNDVPRLTFWLSNSIMLRAIVSQTVAELAHSNVEREQSKQPVEECDDDWEDVMTFIIALEEVESWLFSRIVESLWWQTFTPHMQPNVSKFSIGNAGSVTNKPRGKKNTLGHYHEQGNHSMELWKKTFKDACERLCPIRACGHECGCLSVLVRLVMEQLVNRLDMAMFNAILRQSAEEMPTDPVSDPISDPKVLPIPSGKASFGAGAQLKNAMAFGPLGLEDDSGETNDIYGDNKMPKPFKAFRLLHALSDLMMLPFGMLADVSIRKEVCPTFGPEIIKRVVNNFVPDEFSPDPISRNIIDALNSEEISDVSGESLETYPCTANPTKYSPPPAALLTCVGEVGSQVLQSSRLSSLNKSYTSDDELDELDSPLTSIIPDSYQSSSALAKLNLMPKEKGGRNVVRYELLRQIWKDDDE